MQKLQLLVAAATMFALVGVVAAPAAAQDSTVEYDVNPGGESFVFAQVNATDDGSTGAGGGARVAQEFGGVNTDADAGAAVNGTFTGAGVGAFASPFFVGAGAGGGTNETDGIDGEEDGIGGGAGCGIPTLSPTDAGCGASVDGLVNDEPDDDN